MVSWRAAPAARRARARCAGRDLARRAFGDPEHRRDGKGGDRAGAAPSVSCLPTRLGPLVESRFGREVLDRLVDPLIGGINAGEADRLSAEAVSPQVEAVAATVQVAAARAAGRSPRAPARSDRPGLLRPARRDGRAWSSASPLRSAKETGRRPSRCRRPSNRSSSSADGTVQISRCHIGAESTSNRCRRGSARMSCLGVRCAARRHRARRGLHAPGDRPRVGRPGDARVRRRRDRARPRRHRPPGAQARAAHGDGRVVGVHQVGALEAPRSGDHPRVSGPRRRRAGARPRRRGARRGRRRRPAEAHGRAGRADSSEGESMAPLVPAVPAGPPRPHRRSRARPRRSRPTPCARRGRLSRPRHPRVHPAGPSRGAHRHDPTSRGHPRA